MKGLIKISAYMAGAFLVLIGKEAVALLGPPPPVPAAMPPHAGGFIPPSVAGGGFRGGPPVGGGFHGGSAAFRPQYAPHPRYVSPPSATRMGGLAPHSNIRGGGNGISQVPSGPQFHPKGSSSVLPSLAQGKRPGAGGEANGFPSVSGKGGAELVNRAQGINRNDQHWNNWSKQNEGKLANFQADRTKGWNNIKDYRNSRNVAAGYNRPEWNSYKNNVQNYRDNRATEVKNNIRNNYDDRLSRSWRDRYASYYGRSYAGRYWWWWEAATLATVETFLGWAEGESQSEEESQSEGYDYGVNVVYEGDDVYVDGTRVASAEEYSQQATTLANTPTQQPPPATPPESGQPAEYLPLGVWAMVQEEKGDAYMFFQIAIDTNGVVTGTFENLLSGEKSPISGQVDKKTKRVAWKIGSNNIVFETGLQNLTQDVASCLAHLGTDAEIWLLVRLKEPEIPNTPQSVSEAANPS